MSESGLATHAEPRHCAPGLGRVFVACAYDALLTVAILFATGAIVVAARGGSAVPAGDVLFRLLLLAVAFPYYGFCWTHGGQTLAMRTWGIKAVSRTSAGEVRGRRRQSATWPRCFRSGH